MTILILFLIMNVLFSIFLALRVLALEDRLKVTTSLAVQTHEWRENVEKHIESKKETVKRPVEIVKREVRRG